MIELPEAIVLSRQIGDAWRGRRVVSAVANASPHAFCWYFGDPAAYSDLLAGRRLTSSASYGGHVEVCFEDTRLLLCDGPNPRRVAAGQKRPAKHQLLVEFDDGSALVCSVRMYGGIMVYPVGAFDSEYFRVAREKPSPLTDAFDEAYFDALRAASPAKLSAKAFLATEQRVPGLGNGVLQDMLYRARIHPKRRVGTLSDGEWAALYASVRQTLREMTDAGGRDVESDLFGAPGGYETRCSKKTLGAPCLVCGTPIQKEAYLGGAVYYCPACQKPEA